MTRRRDERGAATLVVVMVMFLIVAMLAAYANRNLVFEQRMAGNYVRSAAAQAAAEAGIEWTLALLNGGKLDAACKPSETGTSSFRQRYLIVDPSSGAIKNPLTKSRDLLANCVHTPSGWQCQCPAAGLDLLDPTLASAAVNELQPSFGVQIEEIARNGVLRIASSGCSDSQLGLCVSSNNTGVGTINLLGNGKVRAEAALLSALKVPPAAPLVSRLALTAPQGVGLHNSDTRSGGLLLISGENPPTLNEDRLDSLPGTPGSRALLVDPTLGPLITTDTPDGMFRLYFGMPSTAYKMQPAMKRVKCAGDCAKTLTDAYAAGARMLWVEGDLTISSTTELGSDAEPLVIVTEGNAKMTGGIRLHGLLYTRGNLSWSNDSGLMGLLSGAAISEGAVAVGGQVDFWYQSTVMDRLNKATGSFVRVPGSWSNKL